jgi:hypothetical protein
VATSTTERVDQWLLDAARRRAARYGGSEQEALQALTRYAGPGDGKPINHRGIDWSPLFGVEVELTNARYALRGVVLPPETRRGGRGMLRVAVTAPHTGAGPAEVAYLDPRWWHITPMPNVVELRFRPSRRQTRGPRGLPLYRSDNLPASALATRRMLERQYRRRPADGQQPVAEYRSMHDYADLYAIDDAAPLAALPPARQAEWDRVRTCARCDKRSPEPYRPGGDGQRYCLDCYSPAADAWWSTQLERAQCAASTWASTVLADDYAVIAACAGWPITRIVVLEINSGAVMHDFTAALGPQQDYERWWSIAEDDPRLAACSPLPEVAARLSTLVGRRFISWTSGLWPVASRLIDAGLLDPAEVGGRDAWEGSDNDYLTRWFALWLSAPAHQPRGELRWSGSWNQAVFLRSRPKTLDPAAHENSELLLQQCRGELTLLREIAAGPPSQERAEQARRAEHPYPEIYLYPDRLVELARLEPNPS